MIDSAPNPKQIVAAGYDRIAERYSEWTGTELRGPRAQVVATLRARLPHWSDILDLGCATGIPLTKALAEFYAVTGVDISARQIDLARQSIPEARFICSDMTTLRVPDRSVDGIVATYSLTHVPREEHPALFAKIAGWLRPGGWFVGSLSVSDDPGTVDGDWLGVPMYFSGDTVETGLQRLRDAGLEIVSADQIVDDEDGVPVPFLWVVAQKPELPE